MPPCCVHLWINRCSLSDGHHSLAQLEHMSGENSFRCARPYSWERSPRTASRFFKPPSASQLGRHPSFRIWNAQSKLEQRALGPCATLAPLKRQANEALPDHRLVSVLGRARRATFAPSAWGCRPIVVSGEERCTGLLVVWHGVGGLHRDASTFCVSCAISVVASSSVLGHAR